jgi:hypothetical protein
MAPVPEIGDNSPPFAVQRMFTVAFLANSFIATKSGVGSGLVSTFGASATAFTGITFAFGVVEAVFEVFTAGFVDAVLALPKLKQADFTALSLDLSKFKQLRVIVCELESIDQVKTLYNLRGLDIKHIKTMPNEFQCLDVINNLERLQWMRIDGKSLSTNVMEVLGRRWGKARKIEKIKKILLCIKGNKDVLREIIKEL